MFDLPLQHEHTVTIVADTAAASMTEITITTIKMYDTTESTFQRHKSLCSFGSRALDQYITLTALTWTQGLSLTGILILRRS